MKNLIDALHELDEKEYKVSEDFSQRVLQKCHSSHSGLSKKWAISVASLGVVACLVTVMVMNKNVDMNHFFLRKSGEINMTEQTEQVSMATGKNDMFSRVQAVPNETKGFIGQYQAQKESDSAKKESSMLFSDNLDKSSLPQMQEQAVENNTVTNTISGEEITNYTQVVLNSIIDILKENAISYEQEEELLKVKASKDQLKELLGAYEDITLEEAKNLVTIIRIAG